MISSIRTSFVLLPCFVTTALVLVALSSSPLLALPSADGDFNVVRLIDHTGAVKYEIMESDIIPLFKKEAEDEYKKAKTAWSEERDAWKEAYGKEIPFVQPLPIKPSVSVLAKKLPSRSDAKIEMETLGSQGPFCVVQVVMGIEKRDPEVIQKTEINFKKYALEMNYHDEIKTWAQAKAEFDKANPGQKFEERLPQKPQLKILKNGLRSLDKANAYLSKYIR